MPVIITDVEEVNHHHDPITNHCNTNNHCNINNLLLQPNNKIIDLGTISTCNNNTDNISVFNTKLLPIHITFDAFSILFFKQKSRRKTQLDTRFINILFNKIKAPLLQKITQQYPALSCKNNILLHKEIFSISLAEQIKNITCLDSDEFKRSITFYNTHYVRIIINVLVKTINTMVNIDFIFNIQNKPEQLCDQIGRFIFEK